MIVFLFFLVFLLLAGGYAYLATRRGMEKSWRKEGPARIVERLRRRNRAVLLVTFAFLVVIAAFEFFIVDFHNALLDLQYAIGDPFGSDPALIAETAYGGLSWGLYLGVFLGVMLGLIVGTFACCRRYPLLSGVGFFEPLFGRRYRATA